MLPILGILARRLFLAFAAFGVGYCFLLLPLTLPDPRFVGPPAINTLAIQVVTVMAVVLALLVGLVLRVPPLWRWWSRSKWPALALAGGCLVLYALGDRDVGLAYFGLVFAIANWPLDGERGLGEKPEPRPPVPARERTPPSAPLR